MRFSIIMSIIIFLVIISFPHEGQTEGCTGITFEWIPGMEPIEKMEINDQYFNFCGVSFRLSNGESPRLAQVGSPLVSFEGVGENKDDQPAANQHVGNFFLTDDSTLGVGSWDAFIIDYREPVSAASAVLLDIDALEEWVIEAHNESGEVIDSIILRSGDENTGDGIASPWSFSMESPVIQSIQIRYTGENRSTVGFALDNFSPSSSSIITPEDDPDLLLYDPDFDFIKVSQLHSVILLVKGYSLLSTEDLDMYIAASAEGSNEGAPISRITRHRENHDVEDFLLLTEFGLQRQIVNICWIAQNKMAVVIGPPLDSPSDNPVYELYIITGPFNATFIRSWVGY